MSINFKLLFQYITYIHFTIVRHYFHCCFLPFSNPDPFLHASLFFPIGTISPTCSMLRVINVKILLNITSYETLLLLSVRSKYFFGPCLYFLSQCLYFLHSCLYFLGPCYNFLSLVYISSTLFIFPRPYFIFPRPVFSWDWMHEWHTTFPTHIKKYKPKILYECVLVLSFW